MTQPDPKLTAARSGGRETVLLVANPASGRGRGGRWLARARTRLQRHGRDVEVLETSRPGEARERAEAGFEGLQGVWAIGGDGTINELLPGLVGGAVPLSILPAGTGNVVAREAGIPLRFSAAFPLALEGQVSRVDVGQVNGQPFLFMVSTGFDAQVVEEVSRQRSGPMRLWQYLPAVWRCRAAPEVRVRVEADGEVLGGAAWVAVMNTSRYAGGFRLCPGARMDDGVLDVLLLRDPVGSRLMRVLGRALRGRFASLRDGLHRPCRSLRIEGARAVQVDGDPWPAQTLDLSLLPAALPLRGAARS